MCPKYKSQSQFKTFLKELFSLKILFKDILGII